MFFSEPIFHEKLHQLKISVILDAKPIDEMPTDQTWIPEREGPPSTADMAHTIGSEEHTQKTRILVERNLEPLGLTWNDIEDVMLTDDYRQLLFHERRLASYTIRLAHITNLKDSKVRIIQIRY